MCNFYNTRSFFKVLLSGIFLLTFISQAEAQIKIGTNGAIISPSSLLELESANQGLLLPRLADTAAINGLNPPNGMLIYLTKTPAVGLYVRKVNGWEYITGSLAGNGNFNSLTVANAVTAGSFSGPLNGNATTATLAATATNSNNSAITNDLTTTTVTYPTFVTQTPGNTSLRTSSTNLSYIPSTGILTARGFNGPLVGNVTGTSTASTDAQNTVNIRVTDDVLTAATVYPTFVSGITGAFPARVSSSKLAFIPSTGELTATTFRGNLIGNASTSTTVSGSVAAINGGTGQQTYTPGDILFAGTSISLDKLSAGTGNAGRVLRVNGGGFPEWQLAGAGSVTNVSSPNNTISIVDPTVAPQIDISVTYPGQASIRSVGALSAGSLTTGFTPVNVAQGGSGLSSIPIGVVIGNLTNPVTSVNGGLGLVLTSNGNGLAPSFQAPAGTGDMLRSGIQDVTGAKTFFDGTLILKGSGAGFTTLKADAGVSGIATLPPGNVTLVSVDGIQTLVNKSFTGPTGFTGTTTLATTNVTDLNISGTINTQSAASVVNGGIAASAATSGNTINRIVSRDGNGDFSARFVSATLLGNATTASLATNATTAATATGSEITTTNANSPFFLTFVAANNGTQPLKVSTGAPSLTYNPSTGLLATDISGKAATVTTNANLTGPISSTGNATSLTASTGAGAIVLETSPALIGAPTAPTAANGTSTTQIATTAFVGMAKYSNVSESTSPGIAAGAEAEVDYPAAAALITGTAVVSPVAALDAGLGIMSVRVSAAGVVTVRYRNFSGGVINPTVNLNITSINP